MKTKNILLSMLCASMLVQPFGAGGQSIILTSDQQLEDLTHPDRKIDNSLGYTPQIESLREICERGRRHGSKEAVLAFDEFFRQYRTDKNTERKLTPDMDEFVDKIKIISDFAKTYDIGLCLSLLSPLELGAAYKKQTGKSGRWLAYKVAPRNVKDGAFSLEMWQQLFWTNNKGRTPVTLKGVKAYAFKERKLSMAMREVKPEDIVPLKDVHYEVIDSIGGTEFGEMSMKRLRIFGKGDAVGGADRVLVMLEYESQEMDYFDPGASDFLKRLMKKYYDKGVNITSLYSDEMHIQQDWYYFGHQEEGQFACRFFTESMAKRYREKFGTPIDDRYMLYFVYGPPTYRPTVEASMSIQYVMGETPADMHRTFLLRDRYYRLLNDDVVDLFNGAKTYAEQLYGRELRTNAHASWAQSPTIDYWDTEKLPMNRYKYEYTPNFVYGNTVHQAAAGCYDYFKWGEYLEPTGNDFAEGGWSDRDYYGAAMAASIGVINKHPMAYAESWGMPDKAHKRKRAVSMAYGYTRDPAMLKITGGVHRDVDVLMVYPMNLVAVDQRFGSWMTQYGYANYLTSDKLVAMGKVTDDGKLRVAEKEYGTLVALFEPLPEKGLLDLMERFVEAGGKVVWMSMPPLLDKSGEDCTAQWQRLFGARYSHDCNIGEIACAKQVTFEDVLKGIPNQTIPTDFTVDRIYPVECLDGATVIARESGRPLGVRKRHGKGEAYYFGFRLRDDQSQSLGYEERTMFEVLNACGAYPSTGKFKVNDNPSYLSRTGSYLVTAFPKNTTMVTAHYRTHPETWPGGFSRNREEDSRILEQNPLDSDAIMLDRTKINGHEVSFDGNLSMSFRMENGRLTAFSGQGCTGIRIDGRMYRFTEKPADILFAPEADSSTSYVRTNAAGSITLPVPAGVKSVEATMGGKPLPCRMTKQGVVVTLEQNSAQKHVSIRYSR